MRKNAVLAMLLVLIAIIAWVYIATTPQKIACCDDPNLSQQQERQIIKQYNKNERIKNLRELFK